MEIAIYGAGVIAYNVASALEGLYHIRPVGYFVTDSKKEQQGFGGIVPLPFSKANWEILGRPQILVATPPTYHAEIIETIQNAGVENYMLVDSEKQYQLMSEYFEKYKKFKMIKESENTNQEKIFEIYMALSKHDRIIQTKDFLKENMYPVHAGSYGSDVKLAKLSDDFSGGISDRNGNYSELTVTYWAWKTRSAAYKGLCHYRRWLQLTESNIGWILENEIDVILPLPYLCKLDASEQYGRYIQADDMACLLEVVFEIYPDKVTEIREILGKNYLYNHNIVIAKEAVFDQYCEFLFSILFEVEKRMQKKGIDRQDRYLGYLGEVLTSIYFVMNQENLRIVHAPLIVMA